MNQEKTYRAIRHMVVRAKQNSNDPDVHHPKEKILQVGRVMEQFKNEHKGPITTLELFAGQGNLTREYQEHGSVEAYDIKYLKTGDSFLQFHRLIFARRTYQVVDLDPYGFPTRLFPDIFLLIKDGLLFVTFPRPNSNILDGMKALHLESYMGKSNPSEEEVINQIATWGLCHWRQVELLDRMLLKSVWRFAFRVKKVKATDYTGVRNQPYEIEEKQPFKQLTIFQDE